MSTSRGSTPACRSRMRSRTAAVRNKYSFAPSQLIVPVSSRRSTRLHGWRRAAEERGGASLLRGRSRTDSVPGRPARGLDIVTLARGLDILGAGRLDVIDAVTRRLHVL